MLLSRGISKPLIKSLIHLHIFYRLTSITRFVFTQFYLHCHILLWYIYEQYIETISYHPFNVLINIHLPILYRLMFLGYTANITFFIKILSLQISVWICVGVWIEFYRNLKKSIRTECKGRFSYLPTIISALIQQTADSAQFNQYCG